MFDKLLRAPPVRNVVSSLHSHPFAGLSLDRVGSVVCIKDSLRGERRPIDVVNLHDRGARIQDLRVSDGDAEILIHDRVADLSVQVVWYRAPLGEALVKSFVEIEARENTPTLTEATFERVRRLTEREERPAIPVVAECIKRGAQVE